jgi:hypothetical protein
VRLPWWLNPWREVRILQLRLVEQHGNIVAAREQMESAARDAAHWRSQMEAAQRQLAAAVTDAKVSGSALATSVPEFILVGIPRGNGKRIQVSRNIEVTAFTITEPGDGEPRFKIGAVMGHLLVIDKPTYADCLAHLATIWENQNAEAANRAVTGGLGTLSATPRYVDKALPPGSYPGES